MMCKPVSGELTYGLERLAMYVLGVDHVMDDAVQRSRQTEIALSYGDVFQQTEQKNIRAGTSTWPTRTCLFAALRRTPRAECHRILAQPKRWTRRRVKRIVMAHPAYDQCIKASHLFNLLDARGVISVTERQSYILRVRTLAKSCADAFLETEAGGGAQAGAVEAAE